MSLEKLEFGKTWTNPSDFPTFQESESQVRADLQYHPDEIKNFINEILIPALENNGVLEITRTDGTTMKYIRRNNIGIIETSLDGKDWTPVMGGHTIVDKNGKEATYRSKLKFVNATVTDDGTHTVIEVDGVEDMVSTEGGANIEMGESLGDGPHTIEMTEEDPDMWEGVTTFNGRKGAVLPQSGDYTAAQVGARPNTWLPTIAEIGAAPAGFGLGEASGRSVVDPKEAIKPGFYCPSGDTAADMPAGGYSLRYGTLLAERRGNAVELTLRYQNSTAKGYGALTNGVLTSVEWEWENSPMQLGVEYRTTERFGGQPVYTRLIKITPLVIGENSVTFSEDFTFPVRQPTGCMVSTDGSRRSLPFVASDQSNQNTYVKQSQKSVQVHLGQFFTEAIAGTQTAYVQIWYTKTAPV